MNSTGNIPNGNTAIGSGRQPVFQMQIVFLKVRVSVKPRLRIHPLAVSGFCDWPVVKRRIIVVIIALTYQSSVFAHGPNALALYLPGIQILPVEERPLGRVQQRGNNQERGDPRGFHQASQSTGNVMLAAPPGWAQR